MAKKGQLSKKDRIKQIEKERGKKKILIWTISVLSVLILITFVVKLSSINQNNPDIKNPHNLSQTQMLCISENYEFYGTEWCGFCKEQKRVLGTDLTKMTYINCEIKKEECQKRNIEGYPTSFITNKETQLEEKFVGVQSVEKILEITNC